MTTTTPKGDLLLGANAIADHLGITRRQVYRLIYDDLVPSFKIGGAVAARRSTLDQWLDDRDAEALMKVAHPVPTLSPKDALLKKLEDRKAAMRAGK